MCNYLLNKCFFVLWRCLTKVSAKAAGECPMLKNRWSVPFVCMSGQVETPSMLADTWWLNTVYD